jgi:hypothetical protein
LGNAERRADELRVAMEQMRREQKDAEREELRRTVPLQWVGAGLFAAGALLGMWANLAC